MNTRSLLLTVALAAVPTIAVAQPAAKPAVPAATQNTIVLVHGAFADGGSWDKVIPLLEAKGYNVIAVHEPLTGLADDVAATNRAIEGATGNVTLVGHSYGGVVITEAGNNPKVKSLVFVAAFAPDAGESITDLGKGQPAPPWTATLKVDSGGFATLPATSVATFFAQDLSAAEQKIVTATQGPTSTKNFDGKIKTAAWHTKPSWYVRAENDKMIDPGAEAIMAKRANATVTSLKASHVVMLSKPADVAKVILAAATAANLPTK